MENTVRKNRTPRLPCLRLAEAARQEPSIGENCRRNTASARPIVQATNSTRAHERAARAFPGTDGFLGRVISPGARRGHPLRGEGPAAAHTGQKPTTPADASAGKRQDLTPHIADQRGPYRPS
jgi:hypothetical protein